MSYKPFASLSDTDLLCCDNARVTGERFLEAFGYVTVIRVDTRNDMLVTENGELHSTYKSTRHLKNFTRALLDT